MTDERFENFPPTQFPRVRGRCPSCGSESLFLGANGYVTCSVIGCKDPGAPTDLLAKGRQAGVDVGPLEDSHGMVAGAPPVPDTTIARSLATLQAVIDGMQPVIDSSYPLQPQTYRSLAQCWADMVRTVITDLQEAAACR